MNLIQKFFRRHNHPHVIKVVNLATCGTGVGTRAITAWRYDCVLCGKVIMDYTKSALELIDTGGRKSIDIFRWSLPDKKADDDDCSN